jgi:ADP-heptose:LPS heptosyltransferase
MPGRRRGLNPNVPALLPTRSTAESFPEATPLNAFFRWNEGRAARDRRYLIARGILRLLARLGEGEAARKACIGHLVGGQPSPAAAAAAGQLVDRLRASIGSPDIAAHAAVFRAFEELATQVDLHAVAWPRRRAQLAAARLSRPEILIIKLGALGDLVQALGTVPEIRRHHPGARITLLTSARHAEFVEQTRLFDAILVDPRPRWFDITGWLELRRILRRPRFDRVYDLQTSDRTSFYARLLGAGRTPEWSGIAWRCSHPHANFGRDRAHTLDRQAEQLLMAGIHPVPIVDWLPPMPPPMPDTVPSPFALLIPGSSPGHPEKRWPAARYAELAGWLQLSGCLPVVVGIRGEEEIARTIAGACPAALDLVGHTDIPRLATLARQATLTVGNDTGATHVAAACGNPVVVLFSQASVPSLCAPRGPRVQVLSSADLADLPVATVIAAAREALGRCVSQAPQSASG